MRFSVWQYFQNTYLTLIRSSKSTSTHTLPSINLMKNSASEVFCTDHATSYQHAFKYIRQLAIHLRNSMKLKTKVLSLMSSGYLLPHQAHVSVCFRNPTNKCTTGNLSTPLIFGVSFWQKHVVRKQNYILGKWVRWSHWFILLSK